MKLMNVKQKWKWKMNGQMKMKMEWQWNILFVMWRNYESAMNPSVNEIKRT